MLAQNFKTATDLGISDIELDALIEVLGMLEREEIDQHHFDMANFLDEEDCGTVACICGWAHYVSNHKAFPELLVVGTLPDIARRAPALRDLFMFHTSIGDIINHPTYRHQRSVGSVTPAEAAIALRSYLTTGDANWSEALAPA